MNRSRAAGEQESALAASRSVGIGWSGFREELVTQNDVVLESPGRSF